MYNIFKSELVYLCSLKVFIKLCCMKAFSKSCGDNKVSSFMKYLLGSFQYAECFCI